MNEPKTDDTARDDGLTNVVTGLGQSGYDKRAGASYDPIVVTDIQARQIWRASDMAARGVEEIVNDSLRPGVDLQIQDDKDGEQGRAVMAKLEDLGALEVLKRGGHYKRAYGGAALFPVANDGRDLAAPLDEEHIAEVKQIQVFEPCELDPLSYYTDPREKGFGQVKLWRFTPITNRSGEEKQQEIHESRLIVMQGIRVTRADVGYARPGWGDSIFTRALRVLINFDSVFDGTGVLVQDFAQSVYRLVGLAKTLAAGGEAELIKRMRLMDLSRSTLRAIIMDKEDEFHREPTPLGGLPEIIDRFCQRLAAAFNMPVTKLMGISAAGLNATGENDRVGWDNTVDAWRESELRGPIERLVRLLLLSKAGPTKGKEPQDWAMKFRPLWQPSEKETVETRKVQADTDAVYFNMGAPAGDLLRSRFGGPRYSIETKIDFAEMERMQAAEEEARAAQEAAQLEALKQPGDEQVPPGEPDEPDESKKEEEAA